jgi:hypothetical protein
MRETALAFTAWSRFEVDRVGRMGVSWVAAMAADPTMAEVAVVVSLRLGSREFRVASVPVRSVSSRTGLRRDAIAGLIEDPVIDASYTLGEGASGARTLNVSVDGALVDALALIRDGGVLVGVAEVALERVDVENDYEQRAVILRGDLSLASFGAVNSQGRELVTFQIKDPRESLSARLPPWVLDTDKISTLPDASQGATYPIVLNEARGLPAVRTTRAGTGSNSWAFAHGIGPWTGLTVYVNGVAKAGGGGGPFAWTQDTAADADGIAYSRIRFTNAGKVWDTSDAVNVRVTERASTSWLSPVEIARYVCESFSPFGVAGLAYDLWSTAAARWPSGLAGPRVVINASGGSAATILSWLETGFLASYPMLSMVFAAGGYGPILTDARAEPIATFVVGADVLLGRASQITSSSKSDALNEVSVRWGYDLLLDSYEGVVTRSPANSAVCAMSRALFGQRDAVTVDSPYISDKATAAYVADWLVAHRALPSYLVEYDAIGWVVLRYRLGDTVFLTDESLGWDRVRATIDGIVYQRGRATVQLRVWLSLGIGVGATSRPHVR